jgi:hypothetical protein
MPIPSTQASAMATRLLGRNTSRVKARKKKAEAVMPMRHSVERASPSGVPQAGV